MAATITDPRETPAQVEEREAEAQRARQEEADRPKKYRFRVLQGLHSEGGKVYGKGRPDGDVVETDNDLSKHNGESQLTQKFLNITHGTPEAASNEVDRLTKENKQLRQQLESTGKSPAHSTGDIDGPLANDADLHKLTVPQLLEYAEDEEIDIGDATRKDDIIAAIALHRGN